MHAFLINLLHLLLPTVFGFAGVSKYHQSGIRQSFIVSHWKSARSRQSLLYSIPTPHQQQQYVPSIVELPEGFTKTLPTRGIILVDPFSNYHSGYMTDLAMVEYGVGVVRVISPYIAKGISSKQENTNVMDKVAPLDPVALRSWVEQIPFKITAVICESDSGLDYAEQLACALEHVGVETLKHNGYQTARRDKFAMNELCRSYGILVVTQSLSKSVLEEEKTSCNEITFPLIVKPRRGVASDRVALCRTPNELSSAVLAILNSTVFGTYEEKHDAVLIQEYVDGTEYAIDVVSKDGVHKVAALWVYDKTSTSDDGLTNPFAYLSGRLVDETFADYLPAVMDYVDACLTALDIRWGMSHTEVKVRANGDIRLMEVNVRQQNDNFGPLCNACLGYNAMELCLSAYLEDSLFEKVPSRPILQCHGMIVNLACFVEGKVLAMHHLNEIEELDSVQAIEIYPAFYIGQSIQRTVDIRSDCGWVHLVNDSEEEMMNDYNKICEWMPTIFAVESL